MDDEPVVELRGLEVAHVCLEDERFDSEIAKPLVAAGIALEVLDAGHFEPDEVVRVVDDPLRVRLREADLHLG